jgi:DNA-binding CsgD family transcriptional regulator
VDASLRLLDAVDDPGVRTSFLNGASHIFLLAGEFLRSRDAAARELAEARRFGLSFVLPHALARKAMAEVGLGDFAAAQSTLAEVTDDGDDAYARVFIAIVRLRLAVASGSTTELDDSGAEAMASKASAATYGEYVSLLALYHACRNEPHEAIRRLTQGVLATACLEARMFAASAAAILRLSSGSGADLSVDRLARLAVRSNCWEPLVCAIRGYQPLLSALAARDGRIRAAMLRIARDAADLKLARALGARVDRGVDSLTHREREVHALLAEGLTNREIARRLFISESTAKVHVRHVMEKLDAQTRTAAARRFDQTS